MAASTPFGPFATCAACPALSIHVAEIPELVALVIQDIIQNQFAQAGIATTLFGSALYQMRALPARAWDLFVARASSAIVLEQHDDLYEEAVHWCLGKLRMWRPDAFTAPPTLLTQEEIEAIRGAALQTPSERYSATPVAMPSVGSGRSDWRHSGKLVPVSAFMVGIHERTFVTATASRRVIDAMSGNGAPSRIDSISIRLWPGGEARLRALARSWAVRRCESEKVEQQLRVYASDPNDYTGWSRVPSVRARPASSVVLADGAMEQMVGDARTFFNSGESYQRRGVPHRRGWMLTGPPGNGKSSACMAVATEVGRDLHAINLRGLSSDNDLRKSMQNTGNCIVVMEDIDCVGLSREPDAEGKRRGITLSGLLNAIDGVGACEGRLLIMTANTPENLDRALVRPGRIDRTWILGNSTEEQIRRMAANFDADEQVIERALALAGQPMAKVQAFLSTGVAE